MYYIINIYIYTEGTVGRGYWEIFQGSEVKFRPCKSTPTISN